jgi:hypothetical protein
LVIFAEDFTESIREGEPTKAEAQVTFVGDLTNPYYTPAALFSNMVLESYLREATGSLTPVLITEEPLGGSGSRSEF